MVQTRSETTGLNYHDTILDAIHAAKSDSTIWKISYMDSAGKNVRMVRQANGDWKNEPLLYE